MKIIHNKFIMLFSMFLFIVSMLIFGGDKYFDFLRLEKQSQSAIDECGQEKIKSVNNNGFECF